ncbi:uncharacterized protein [Dysidea avara]|uniref:uncharacterized protein n=1 Tax=Dysidea avara TaxID=196820 RepID=UPI00331853F3
MKCLIAGLVLVLCALTTSGELTDFLLTHDEVHGVYKNEDGSLGIKFTSRVDFLHVTTLDDITMVYFNSFQEVNKRMARSVNITDTEYLQHQYASHSQFDGPVSNDSKSFDDAVKDLLGMEEGKLLEDASRAVGERGVIGRDTPAVMPFFMFALKITKLLDSYSTLQHSNTNEISETKAPRDKRFFVAIYNAARNYFRGGCSRPIHEPYCKGRCGKGCDCWWWVCGDCCWHQACYDHDDCCERGGYYHWRCIVAIDVLLCEAPFIC